jgi:hypothetical protein
MSESVNSRQSKNLYRESTGNMKAQEGLRVFTVSSTVGADFITPVEE